MLHIVLSTSLTVKYIYILYIAPSTSLTISKESSSQHILILVEHDAGGRVPDGASSAPRISSNGSDHGIDCHAALFMSPVMAMGVGVYGAEICRGYRAQCGSKGGDAGETAKAKDTDSVMVVLRVRSSGEHAIFSFIQVGGMGYRSAICHAPARRKSRSFRRQSHVKICKSNRPFHFLA